MDTELETEIRQLLDRAERTLGASGLDVLVVGGIVQLQGAFKSKNQLEATIRAVAGVDGVVGIRNRMVYDREDAEFLTLALSDR